MELSCLCESFAVRRLTAEDVELVYELSRGNRIFYEYHPPFVTRESILEDMAALPPGKQYEDKFYLGFFSGEQLVAVMDLIRDFPAEKTAFVGLFMMEPKVQGKGIGSKILGECIGYLQKSGFLSVQLGVDRGTPQSYGFWKKNGFRVIEEGTYIRMERKL